MTQNVWVWPRVSDLRRLALESPDEIRQSRSDTEVLLFYKAEGVRVWPK